MISLGGFYKEAKDFFGNLSRQATAQDLTDFGLPPEFLGYSLTTTINTSGTAKIEGGEFNFRQPLTMIPGWGRYSRSC